jgi:hypothetical protein
MILHSLPQGKPYVRLGPAPVVNTGQRTVPRHCKAADFGPHPSATICIDRMVRFVNGRLVEWREP